MSYNEIDRIVEKDEFNKEQKKVIERVRARKSYKLFSALTDLLTDFKNSQKSAKEFLFEIHKVIDTHRGFGSETNSNYAVESIELLAKDRGID